MRFSCLRYCHVIMPSTYMQSCCTQYFSMISKTPFHVIFTLSFIHAPMNCFDTLGNTIWNNRLEILSEIEFCQIGENYYTDAETGRAIQKKRRARREARHESVRRELPDAFKCAALKYVQRQPRMKSCKLAVITYL